VQVGVSNLTRCYKVPPSPAALAAAKSGRKLAITAYTSIAAALLMPMLIAPWGTFWLITVALGILTATIMKTTGRASQDNQRLSDVKRDWTPSDRTGRRHRRNMARYAAISMR
jgi:hypothetical protein